jgi:hydroxyacylglutathione hydrolase
MLIERLIVGSFETNCYVLRSSPSKRDCILIDAGLEADSLIDYLRDNNLTPVAVLLTHGHIDHIAGLDLLRQQYPGLKIYIHRLDERMLEGVDNLSELAGLNIQKSKSDFFLEDGSFTDVISIILEVLHTPGHTPGSVCLYSSEEKVIFVGDTIFAGSVGRTDFPGGSTDQLLNSIKEKILTLPDDTKILPGHGPPTSVALEKKQNPFLRDFVDD